MREFLRWMIGLTIVSAIYCVVMRLVFHLRYPYSWPFFLKKERFSDFWSFREKFTFFHTAAFFTTGFPINYPAPLALLYEVFFKFGGSHATQWFVAFIVCAFVVPAVLFQRALHRHGLSQSAATRFAVTSLILSWPILLMLDRGNVEIFVWVVLAVATWAYATGREWTGAAMFGVAAALKLFPFVYLALFLTRRKLPKLMFGALVFGVVSIASLAVLGPTTSMAYHGIAYGMNSLRLNWMAWYTPNQTGHDHSILAFCKALLRAATGRDNWPLLLNVYLPVSAIAGVLLYFLRIRKLPWWNQLLVLSIISIYFTAYSMDYTLVHLYYSFAICCFLAMDAWRRRLEVPGLRAIFLCFAWIFSIESFFVIRGYRFVGQGKCIGIGILLFCALKYPLGPPVATEEEPLFPDASRIKGLIGERKKGEFIVPVR